MYNFNNIFKKIFSKHEITITKFTLFYSFLLILFNINFIKKVYGVTNTFCSVFGTILILYIMSVIFHTILFNKYTTKFFAILFLAIHVPIIYFINTYNISIDYVMLLNVIETNPSETMELLNFVFLFYLLLFFVLPSIYIIKFIDIKYDNIKFYFIKKFIILFISFIILLLIIYFNYKSLSSTIRTNRYLRSDLIPYNYMNSIDRLLKNKLKKQEFKDITINIKEPEYKNKNLMIFIVGEAARAKSFSLGGYEVNTNELLDNNILYFNNVESCGTSTAISVPCMFSVYTRKDYNVEHRDSISNLLDFVKKAGFYTLWIDNNSDCKGVCERADEVINLTKKQECKSRICYDEEMLYDIEDKIKNINSDNIAIFLHQIGSHGPAYYLRYPEKFEKFKPVCKTEYFSNCKQEEIVNSYNNAIYYTSYFINETINILKDEKNYDSFLFYISDHGQSLGENGIYLHGAPYLFAPKEQKEVPMIMWFSDSFIKNNNLNIDCIKNKNNLSQDNVFHSIIGLYNIKTSYYNSKLDIFDGCK